MRLAALYIHEHFLFELPQTLNFGGKYRYNFTISKGTVIEVTTEINESFVEGFFGNGITQMSAIVGANGAGKTNILKIINAGYEEHTKCVFVYENSDGSLWTDIRMNERGDQQSAAAENSFTIAFSEGITHHEFDPQSVTRLYYSPVFDASIPALGSPLTLNATDPENKLGNIFMDNIRKDAVFLHSEVSKTIKEIYADFPSYETLFIVPKILHKRDFRKVYIDSNLGNPQKTETLKHSIERDLRVKRFGNPEGLLNEYLNILENSNITDALNEVWEMAQYQNITENREHLLHDSGDFLKNIEINIISFLVLNDTFSVTEFTGSYDFEKILKSTSFDEILDHFLAKYIVQFDKYFYNEYKNHIRLDNADELIQIVMGHYLMNVQTYSDLQISSMIKTNIHHNINGLKDIKRLYEQLKNLSDHTMEDEGQSVLRIDVQREDIENVLDELFNIYSKVREYFSHLPMSVKEIIDIDTNVHLSYGEKSILNLYSTFYEFTQMNSEFRESENFLLILDEADLGYHPLWKRKFISALSLTMPKLFSDMRNRTGGPISYNAKNTNGKFPNLQFIMATHDPLTLSDFPNDNVVYLRKSKDAVTDVLQNSSHSMKSFGANITDLLAHSFFVEDGLIGDFARQKIEHTIEWINDEKTKKDFEGQTYTIDPQAYGYHQSVIKIVDEPVIRIKLAQMLDDLKDQKEVQRELIRREIEMLNEKLANI